MRSRGIDGRLGMAIVALFATSCAPAELDRELDVAGVSAAALGEPRDGFPTWEERVVHVWTNRSRAAPAADLASCTVCAERACYTPQPPLAWTHDLARAARFHSENLQRAGCGLQHASPCTLVAGLGTSFTPGPCNGAPSCACAGGSATCGSTGSSTWDRLAAFGYSGGSRGENIASGRSDPVLTYYQWMHESDTSSACGFRGSNGHRYSILNGAYRGIGVGKASAGNVWTQDFTSTGAPTGIVAGVHYPRTGASIDFRANWYSTATVTSAEVNVDGDCHAMSVERGTAANGTYLATVSLGAGCHRYVFRFETSAGVLTYPSTGTYGVGCASDWDAAAPPACGCAPTCAGRTCGADGCGGSCGTCPAGQTCSASGTCACVPMCTGRTCGSDGCGGSCGSCAAGEVCAASGTCACAGGTTRCGGACVDTATSTAHCGSCGVTCAGGQPCVAGTCIAPGIDAGPVPVDSGAAPFDSGAGPLDSGAGPFDSGAGPVDSGAGPVDASAPEDDAAVAFDAASARDGSIGPDAAATSDRDTIIGGCACHAIGAPHAQRSSLALLALTLALAFRRRRARIGGGPSR